MNCGSIEMVHVEGGTFMMGASENDRFANRHELPPHEVMIPAFTVGKFPVTESQYAENTGMPATSSSLPVVNVTWKEAQAFCASLSCRLPTEEEWEYLYRAGTQTVFPQGDFPNITEGNYLYDEEGHRIGPGRRVPVGSYPLNALGIGDLLGNVAEWTSSTWKTDYRANQANNKTVAPLKVIRGAGWDGIPRLLRCSNRDFGSPDSKKDNLGFRIVLET